MNTVVTFQFSTTVLLQINFFVGRWGCSSLRYERSYWLYLQTKGVKGQLYSFWTQSQQDISERRTLLALRYSAISINLLPRCEQFTVNGRYAGRTDSCLVASRRDTGQVPVVTHLWCETLDKFLLWLTYDTRHWTSSCCNSPMIRDTGHVPVVTRLWCETLDKFLLWLICDARHWTSCCNSPMIRDTGHIPVVTHLWSARWQVSWPPPGVSGDALFCTWTAGTDRCNPGCAPAAPLSVANGTCHLEKKDDNVASNSEVQKHGGHVARRDGQNVGNLESSKL
jgi:hypothetical protein